MRIAAFGHGLPLGLFAALGLAVKDVTLAPSAPCPQVAGLIEDFMDPFAASVLHRLAGGTLSGFDLLIFLRESPGAVHAFHYACEFARRGLLPVDAPDLHLLNLIPATTAAATRFNRAQLDRLAPFAGAPLPPPEPSAPADTAPGPRQALLGAPLGNRALQDLVRRAGLLVFDQQAEDSNRAAAGDSIDAALAAQAANPFAARQPADHYLPAVAAILTERKVDRVLWQVDPQDDLWGWLAPDVRRLTELAGARFIDLGFIPRWPAPADIAPLAAQLGVPA